MPSSSSSLPAIGCMKPKHGFKGVQRRLRAYMNSVRYVPFRSWHFVFFSVFFSCYFFVIILAATCNVCRTRRIRFERFTLATCLLFSFSPRRFRSQTLAITKDNAHPIVQDGFHSHRRDPFRLWTSNRTEYSILIRMAAAQQDQQWPSRTNKNTEFRCDVECHGINWIDEIVCAQIAAIGCGIILTQLSDSELLTRRFEYYWKYINVNFTTFSQFQSCPRRTELQFYSNTEHMCVYISRSKTFD